ncbi:TPA: hypothetical protein SLN72_002555 [Morganella morganii]|jgi:hypothetical protein|uniref:Helix-turn-helix domain-containing protein n=1 Tax=Morganella morganii TaxID=582 RepID=A0AAN5RZB0_MORMO|nr:hypothetical protein [Morganella morganii]HAT1528831.1 helix-turn-helix domain-containing protein [Morganella morganii]HAT3808210.1 helix-turn-helix domain-containing protein [Morganella morganii]HED3888137.1 hypothetical protein [Morganella morganii]HEI9845568.1 hypothetical protein [Morganella morganii]
MSDYWSTAKVADYLGVKNKTVILWTGTGKQRKPGFPKAKHKLRSKQFDPEEIKAWRAGKRFD